MSQKWRAKVYALDDTSNWVDKGAGYASVQNVNNGCVIEVWNDESTETLLVIDVVPGDNFRHEQATIVMWEHFGPPESEFALSFQDRTGCQAVWSAICAHLGVPTGRKSTSGTSTSPVNDDAADDDGASTSSSSSSSSSSDSGEIIDLDAAGDESVRPHDSGGGGGSSGYDAFDSVWKDRSLPSYYHSGSEYSSSGGLNGFPRDSTEGEDGGWESLGDASAAARGKGSGAGDGDGFYASSSDSSSYIWSGGGVSVGLSDNSSAVLRNARNRSPLLVDSAAPGAATAASGGRPLGDELVEHSLNRMADSDVEFDGTGPPVPSSAADAAAAGGAGRGIGRGVAGVLSSIVQQQQHRQSSQQQLYEPTFPLSSSSGSTGGATGSLLNSVGLVAAGNTLLRAPSSSQSTGMSVMSENTGELILPLPEVSIANLAQIASDLESWQPRERHELSRILQDNDFAYIRRLLELREEAEDLDCDDETLGLFHRIILCILQCGDATIYERLTASEELFAATVACFDVPSRGVAAAAASAPHDSAAAAPAAAAQSPTVNAPQEPVPSSIHDSSSTRGHSNRRHRDYLKHAVTFREAVPIVNADLLARIHSNFRLQYLKDAVLPRNFDEAALNVLGSSIFFNNTDILQGVLRATASLESVFTMIRDVYSTTPNAMDKFVAAAAAAAAAAVPPRAASVSPRPASGAAATTPVVATTPRSPPAPLSSVDADAAAATSASSAADRIAHDTGTAASVPAVDGDGDSCGDGPLLEPVSPREPIPLLLPPPAAAVAAPSSPKPEGESRTQPSVFYPPPLELSRREKALRLLQELTAMARPLQLQHKQAYFRALSSCKPAVWGLFEGVLCDRHASVEELVAALEVMLAVANNSVASLSELREYCQRQTARRPPAAPREAAAAAVSVPAATSPAPASPVISSDAAAAAVAATPVATSSLTSAAAADSPSAAAPSAASVAGGYTPLPRGLPQSDPAAILALVLLRPPAAPTTSAATVAVAPTAAVALDDGRSIRLYEKLHALALEGHLTGLINSRGDAETFNESRRPAGEHGLLVDGITRQSGLIQKLVWRAVDDPSVAVQSLCMDVLRLIHEPDLAGYSVPETLGVQLFDFHLKWLLAPFFHPSLRALDAPDPGPAVTAFEAAVSIAAAPAAPAEGAVEASAAPAAAAAEAAARPSFASLTSAVRRRLASAFAPGFDAAAAAAAPYASPASSVSPGAAAAAAAAVASTTALAPPVGGESSVSKASKLLVLGFVSSVMSAQLYRFKCMIIPPRCKLLTRVGRLLRYPEQFMVLSAVRFVRALLSTKDAFLVKQFATERMLSPILAAFIRNGPRCNLLHSAVLELLLFISDARNAVTPSTFAAYMPVLQRCVPESVVAALTHALGGAAGSSTSSNDTGSARSSSAASSSSKKDSRDLVDVRTTMVGGYGRRMSLLDAEDGAYFDSDDDMEAEMEADADIVPLEPTLSTLAEASSSILASATDGSAALSASSASASSSSSAANGGASSAAPPIHKVFRVIPVPARSSSSPAAVAAAAGGRRSRTTTGSTGGTPSPSAKRVRDEFDFNDDDDDEDMDLDIDAPSGSGPTSTTHSTAVHTAAASNSAALGSLGSVAAPSRLTSVMMEDDGAASEALPSPSSTAGSSTSSTSAPRDTSHEPLSAVPVPATASASASPPRGSSSAHDTRDASAASSVVDDTTTSGGSSSGSGGGGASLINADDDGFIDRATFLGQPRYAVDDDDDSTFGRGGRLAIFTAKQPVPSSSTAAASSLLLSAAPTSAVSNGVDSRDAVPTGTFSAVPLSSVSGAVTATAAAAAIGAAAKPRIVIGLKLPRSPPGSLAALGGGGSVRSSTATTGTGAEGATAALRVEIACCSSGPAESPVSATAKSTEPPAAISDHGITSPPRVAAAGIRLVDYDEDD